MTVRTMLGRPIDISIVYGERPITELCIAMMTDEDLHNLVSGIELSDGGRIHFDGRGPLKHVFVEAPLGRQFGVVDILLSHDDFCVMCEVKPASYEAVHRRLGIQIPRYLDSLGKEISTRQTELVRYVQRAISGRKVYLVVMTNDPAFPSGLRHFYKGLRHSPAISFGWVSYTYLNSVLAREGFETGGMPRSLWASKGHLDREEEV